LWIEWRIILIEVSLLAQYLISEERPIFIYMYLSISECSFAFFDDIIDIDVISDGEYFLLSIS
jgi:hypothetical protein